MPERFKDILDIACIDPNTAIFNTNFKSAVRHNRRDDLNQTTMVRKLHGVRQKIRECLGHHPFVRPHFVSVIDGI